MFFNFLWKHCIIIAIINRVPNSTSKVIIISSTVYRLSEVFESLLQVLYLLVLVSQEHEKVVLLLLGLQQVRFELGHLRLQDGRRAGGRGRLLLKLGPALRQDLDLLLRSGY